MKYLDSIKKTLKNFRGFIFSQKSKSSLGTLYGYNDIPLRLFIDVANTSNVMLLIKSGTSTIDECVEEWESIIKRNSLENQNFEYQTYFSLIQSYGLLISDYTEIKLMLMKASIVIDRDMIERLRKKGYAISLSNSEAYEADLIRAIKRSENLITKITMKKNELEAEQNQVGGSKEEKGYDEIIANLEFGLGWSVRDDITLSKYNSLKKLVKKKNSVKSK